MSLLWIAGAAGAAPVLIRLFPRLRLPEVVLLLAFGVLIGPYGLGLAHEDESIGLLSEIGLGMLFLVAGMEVDLGALRGRTGRRAMGAWAVSLALAAAVAGAIVAVNGLRSWAALAIAMTSTALGTLLPVLRDTGLTSGPLGRVVMANGAVGELGPIIAMSLLVGTRKTWVAAVALLGFAVAAAVVSGLLLRHYPRAGWLRHIVSAEAETTAQLPVRLVVLLLVAMLALAASFGLDIILGAFIAGVLVHRLLPPDREMTLARIDGLAFGFLVPVFFVTSGMGIDIGVVAEHWASVLVFFVMIVLVRGLPVLAAFRDLDRPHPAQVALFSATGLPIIVAVSAIAVDAGSMTPTGESIVVAAGALTVLTMPLLALRLHGAEAAGTPEPPAAPRVG